MILLPEAENMARIVLHGGWRASRLQAPIQPSIQHNKRAAATQERFTMTSTSDTQRPRMSCDKCKFRPIAEKSPGSFLGRLWIWHTSFCPGWKRYVKTRWEHGEEPPAIGNRRGFWSE